MKDSDSERLSVDRELPVWHLWHVERMMGIKKAEFRRGKAILGSISSESRPSYQNTLENSLGTCPTIVLSALRTAIACRS